VFFSTRLLRIAKKKKVVVEELMEMCFSDVHFYENAGLTGSKARRDALVKTNFVRSLGDQRQPDFFDSRRALASQQLHGTNLKLQFMSSELGCDKELLKDAKRAFDRVDEDHDGSLNFSEFLKAVHELHGDVRIELLLKIWNQVDADHSGQINFDEFATFLVTFFFRT